MNTMRLNNAAGQGAELRTGNLCAKFFRFAFLLGSCVFFLLAPQKAFSQVSWVDMGGFLLGYELSVSDEMLDADEQFYIKLYGDVPATESAIGLLFELGLNAGVSVDAGTELSLPATSWLGVSSDLTTQYEHGAAREKAQVHRPDTTEQAGQGWVLSLHCTVGEDEVSAASVVESLGGSMVMVENIDMKAALENTEVAVEQLFESGAALCSDEASISVFPNPCADWIEMQTQAEGPWELSVLNMNQTAVMRSEILPGERLNISQLPAGSYILLLAQVNGGGIQKVRLIKN